MLSRLGKRGQTDVADAKAIPYSMKTLIIIAIVVFGAIVAAITLKQILQRLGVW